MESIGPRNVRCVVGIGSQGQRSHMMEINVDLSLYSKLSIGPKKKSSQEKRVRGHKELDCDVSS
jgi:hypothetical protein